MQIFESWGHHMSEEQFVHFALVYDNQIICYCYVFKLTEALSIFIDIFTMEITLKILVTLAICN
jgi:hypothetical protein